MSDVLIIGGGPAGMIAAIMAARNDHKVLLIEKNEKLGKKLYITGKGRCNVTNASSVPELLNNVVANKKFLYSAFYSFDSSLLMNFFEELGLHLKIERGNRVFPKSDKSSDVIKVLRDEMQRLDVTIKLNETVKRIEYANQQVNFVITSKGKYYVNKVIVATGGLSYGMTGSTGDGFEFAKAAHHKIIPCQQGLVPIETKEDWVKALQGLSLKNINVSFIEANKVFYSSFGEMLFTHFGLSGPVIISGSSYISKKDFKPFKIVIDLKPSLTYKQLDDRIVRDFNQYSRKIFQNGLNDLLPKKMIPIIIKLSGIDPNKPINQITKDEREGLVHLFKELTCTFKGLRGYNEAIITRGGVNVKEINPNTMESKLINGLYFVGEVLDIDALTGGYNLQIAFSTGYLAGISI